MTTAPPYLLPAIPYLRLRFTLEAEEAARLSEFQGSMLRGAFGHALRRLVCVMGPDQPCPSCPLRRTCPYPRLFEPLRDGEPPSFLRGVEDVARPYVFEPRSPGGPLARGGPLHFDLLLFGQAVELQGYAILAVQRMAAAGLGTRRARFRLVRAEAVDPAAPSESSRVLFGPGVPAAEPPAPPVVPRWEPLPGPAVTLRFLTPLRIRVRDHLTDRPRFRDLAFAMLRRGLELAHAHVPGAALDWNFRPLLDQASQIRIAAANLTWHDQERWSQRQQSAMRLGGIVGALTLEGDLAPFVPLLRTAEIVHVGKGATFGLGQMEVGP